MSFVSSFWTSLVLALIIAGVAFVRGHWSGGVALALIAYLVLAALLPVAGFLIGAVIVAYLVFVHGPGLLGQLSSLLGGAKS